MDCTTDGTTPPRTAGAALELELDRWEAAVTMPRRVVPLRYPLADSCTPGSVDPRLWVLHVRWFRRRRPEVRSALVREYEEPVRHLARRYFRHREPLEDLSQVALEALLVALDRFDPRLRIPFLGFASPTIIGALKRHYRDSGWSIRVPRRAHELAGSIGAGIEALQQDLGRLPTIGELADLLDVTEEAVEETMVAVGARELRSLESPSAVEQAQPVLAVDDPDLGRVEARIALSQALALLDEQDRLLLHRYFELEMSQDRIAAELGVSQMQVSRLLSRVLRRLRVHLAV